MNLQYLEEMLTYELERAGVTGDVLGFRLYTYLWDLIGEDRLQALRAEAGRLPHARLVERCWRVVKDLRPPSTDTYWEAHIRRLIGKAWPMEFAQALASSLESLYAPQLGEAQREALSRDALRGQKVLTGARKGHEKTHGSRAYKNEQWRKLQEDSDELARHPNLSWNRIMQRVAEKHGVSPSTVKRHCRNPRKKPSEK